MKKCIIVLFASLIVSVSSWCTTKALIVTISQKHLSGINEQTRAHLPMILSRTPFAELGEFGTILKSFSQSINTISPQNLSDSDIINAWDQVRADYVRSIADGVYDKVFVLTGDDLETPEIMAKAFASARECDAVDYFSLVHTGDQLIRREWNVPKTDSKLRLVYSSACNGGNGAEPFIKGYHAYASVGHKAEAIHPSASPLFSLSVLKAWIERQPLSDTLKTGWHFGESLLNSSAGFMLARMVASYPTQNDAIEASRFEYAHVSSINLESFTIDSYENKDENEPNVIESTL